MVNKFNSNYFIIIAISFSLFFGVLLRVYNLNYENLWFDEMVSFWVSDPFISFNETYTRHRNAEGSPFLFNFLMKFLYKIFGYQTYMGRYFSVTFGILSIISVTYLSSLLKKNNAYLLVIFLVSFNVFLIKYSQEARLYAFAFFTTSLAAIFLLKSFQSHKTGKNLFLNTFLYIFFQTIAFLGHPFVLIFFFSLVAYYFFYYLKFKKNLIFLNYSILIILILLAIYLPIYVGESIQYPHTWLEHPSLKFFTNFYFSTFFGSRLLGLIHLFLLIGLIVSFRKKIINELNFVTILIIFIFLSYFTPLLYGLLYKPIIHSRYIIFVLIPIIVVLSYLIFEIKNKYIKNTILSILFLLTFGNQFTESNFKQFYEDRPRYKADYFNPLKKINDSDHKNYFVNHSLYQEEKFWSDVFQNYLNIFIKENNFNINQLNLSELKSKIGYVWILCPKDLIEKECGKIRTENIFEFKVIEDVEFNSLILKLIKLR